MALNQKPAREEELGVNYPLAMKVVNEALWFLSSSGPWHSSLWFILISTQSGSTLLGGEHTENR